MRLSFPPQYRQAISNALRFTQHLRRRHSTGPISISIHESPAPFFHSLDNLDLPHPSCAVTRKRVPILLSLFSSRSLHYTETRVSRKGNAINVLATRHLILRPLDGRDKRRGSVLTGVAMRFSARGPCSRRKSRRLYIDRGKVQDRFPPRETMQLV